MGALDGKLGIAMHGVCMRRLGMSSLYTCVHLMPTRGKKINWSSTLNKSGLRQLKKQYKTLQIIVNNFKTLERDLAAHSDEDDLHG